jgi:hypothetical protein
MTVLDHPPRRTADWQPRLHRRHEIVTTGGVEGVLRIGAALTTCGYQVREFVADVQDGVPYGSVTCTVALAADEAALFAERLREVPTVIAVDER